MYCKSRKSLSSAFRWKETLDRSILLPTLIRGRYFVQNSVFFEDWSNFNRLDQYQFIGVVFAFLSITIWCISTRNITERRKINWGWFAITHASCKAKIVRSSIMKLRKKFTEQKTEYWTYLSMYLLLDTEIGRYWKVVKQLCFGCYVKTITKKKIYISRVFLIKSSEVITRRIVLWVLRQNNN